MPTTYQIADEDTHKLAKAVLHQYHRELVEVELTYTVKMAHAEKDEHGKPISPALKHHGWPAAAVVRINKYEDRVEGKTDITINVDADWWEAHDDAQRRALLDHEIQHIEVARDKEGNVKSDDCGRPKLKNREHDYELSGFHAVIARHGENAAEVETARALAVSEGGQQLFGFMKPWG